MAAVFAAAKASRSCFGLNVPEISRSQTEFSPMGQKTSFECACIHIAILFTDSVLKT